MAQSLGDYLHPDRSSTVAVSESRSEASLPSDRAADSVSPSHTPSSTSVPALATSFSSESGDSPYQPCSSSTSSYPPRTRSTQPAVDHVWSYLAASDSSEPPLAHLGPSRDESVLSLKPTSHPSPSVAIFKQEDMSTLGVQFVPQYDAITRPSYTWPTFDMNEPYGNHDMAPLDPFNMSAGLPIYSKSLSSSPPQALFTPAQRELKRQRELARRESKTKQRRDRSLSNNSYPVSHAGTPNLIPRSNESSYSSTMTPASGSLEPSPTFTTTSYMPSLIPQLATCESPELYSAPFPLLSNDFSGNNFIMPYSSNTEQNMTSFQTRPHSLSSASDQPCFYRSSPVTQDSQETVRVVHSRPKPQCWDHGCNGRQFSTFSNLLRHQREKSGVSSKPSCPKCGAEFTRTTARNGHMAHEKCKQRRNSNH